MNILKLIEIIAGLLPLVQRVVAQVEEMFPGAKRGAEKADAAITMVKAVLPQVTNVAEEATQLASAVRPLVNATVSALNLAGHFKRSEPASNETFRLPDGP